MPPEDFERLFLSLLPLIDRVVDRLARRYRIGSGEVQDIRQTIRMKLIDGDYRLLRQFEERSSWNTFITSVVTNAFHDCVIAEWGRWRPSSQAERLGPVAIDLERCLYRDGMTMEEAYERLNVRHTAPPSRAEIEALAVQLPVRIRRYKVSESAAYDIASPDSADAGVRLSEQQERRQRILRVLDEILGELPALDAAILALHFKGGKRWSQIAVIISLPQRSLYPRRDALLKQVGEELERRGISRADVMEFLKEDV